MATVAGIFNSRAEAEQALERLHSAGIPEDRLSLLTPGTSTEEVAEAVPTTETEQPGMGTALGGVAGGAMGVAGGLHLGAAAASLLVPGVGPIFAAGLIGAALLGAGGVAAGTTLGGALEDSIAKGLPHDELFVYEDALRKGRTVVIAVADDAAQAEAGRAALAQAGAESVDAARDQWWVGLRDAEEAEYATQGRDFKSDEAEYRRGFEAALHPQARGKAYDEQLAWLRERFGEDCARDPFKCGYDRGQTYQRGLTEERRE